MVIASMRERFIATRKCKPNTRSQLKHVESSVAAYRFIAFSDLMYTRGESRLMHALSVSLESGIIVDIVRRYDDDYLYEGKIAHGPAMLHQLAIDVESMVPLTETNCVTSYRTETPTALFSPLPRCCVTQRIFV